jgi:PAS domain S-box-containing protein
MRLKTKVLLAFVPAMIAASAIIIVLARQSVHHVLVEELAQRVLSRAAETAAASADSVATRREGAVLPGLQALAEQTRASYAVALDVEGRVIAHTNVVEKGKLYGDAATRRALASAAPDYEESGGNGGGALDVSIPIWARGEDFLLSSSGGSRRVGTLRVGLSLGDAATTESRILRRLGLVLFAANGGAFLLVLFLLARMLSPIRTLREAVGLIGRGQYGVRVPVESRDELGELAESFNRMSADLASTTVSKRFLDDILNSMLDSLVVLDAAGKVRLANAAACRLLGWPEPEMLTLDAARLLPEDAWLGLSSAGHDNVEVLLLSRSGDKIPALLSSSAIADAEGRPSGHVLVARDIRERKAFEARMAQSEKLSAIGQLAAGVSHEINNPLGVILGFAQTLCRKVGDGSELSFPLRSIEREALRCKELVQSLLTFSRQERRSQERLDLTPAVSNALLLVETQARVRGVALRRDLDGNPLPIEGNPNQIQQIVINLCTNALDATPSGGTLTVSCRRHARDGRGWARLQVADTGEGIPESIRKKIYDPFFTTKEPGRGTGLGLALVYELVQHHHGRIDFTSETGRGTTFFVDLPLAEAAAGAKA